MFPPVLHRLPKFFSGLSAAAELLACHQPIPAIDHLSHQLVHCQSRLHDWHCSHPCRAGKYRQQAATVNDIHFQDPDMEKLNLQQSGETQEKRI
jgi:hypothetical protein